MGNSTSNSSTSTRMNKKSESMEIRSKSGRSSAEFCKSKSMMDMSSKSRMASSSSGRQKSITSIKDKDKPKSTRDFKSNEVSRQKSLRKDASHPISNQGRDIISQCFENPHSEFANKVVQRIFEKRDDYQRFILNLGKERSSLINARLKVLVEEIVVHINDPEFIEHVSKQYGEEHVELKQYGFKPDFWVAIADAMTLEGVILDMANHQPADTVSAWSSLVTMIFSSVRDGYYSELRRHRISSRRTLRHQNTVDSREENEIFDEVMNSALINASRDVSRIALNGSDDSNSSTTLISSNGSSHRNILATTPVRRETLRSASLYSTESMKRNGSDLHPTASIRRPIFE